MKMNIIYPATLIIFLLAACNKDNIAVQPASETVEYDRIMDYRNGAKMVVRSGKTDGSQGVADRSAIPQASTQLLFPFYDGKCRVVFKVRGGALPGGTQPNPCPDSDMFLQGYSEPNGGGTLLFTVSTPITGNWQTVEIPESAYIRCTILQSAANQNENEEACTFNVYFGDYGWNASTLVYWVNMPYSVPFPLLTGYYAPFETKEYFEIYERYLCDSWCTWSAPITFDPQEEWRNWSLHFFYDEPVPISQYFHPRSIKSYLLYQQINQVQYFYPVAIGGTYISQAFDLDYSDPLANMTYYVQGGFTSVGPFHWGTSDYHYGCSGHCEVNPTE